MRAVDIGITVQNNLYYTQSGAETIQDVLSKDAVFSDMLIPGMNGGIWARSIVK